jgi:hypothetical protein
MPRYVFVLRHSSFADLQDDAAGMELPDVLQPGFETSGWAYSGSQL